MHCVVRQFMNSKGGLHTYLSGMPASCSPVNSSPIVEPTMNSSANNPPSLFAPLHRPNCLLSTQQWLVILLADTSLRQHRVLDIHGNRFLLQHSCFFTTDLNEGEKSMARLYFLPLSCWGDERNTHRSYERLSAKWGGLFCHSVYVQTYVLSLCNMSGAVNTQW